MRPRPATTTRKPRTICVEGGDAESIAYIRGYLAPYRVTRAPGDSLDECDALILLPGVERQLARLVKPLLLCGDAVLAVINRLEGVRGIAAPYELWPVLSERGFTPLPFEVHSEHLIVSCSEPRFLGLALRILRNLLECRWRGACVEPEWVSG